MKNSHPITKNKIIPVITSDAFSFRLYCVAIWIAPCCINTRRNAMTAIAHTLNFASHATIIAVKPRPPAVLVEIVWEEPLTRINPAIPAIQPEIPTVRTMTFPTLIPA